MPARLHARGIYRHGSIPVLVRWYVAPISPLSTGLPHVDPDIRPLAPEDLPAVARLFNETFGARASRSGAADFLRATLIDQPWPDSDLPSLVYVDGAGRVSGFIGSNVRRMCFDDAQIRVGCCSHLMVAPDSRGTGAGAFLLSRYMAGPQDLTFSDTASPDVCRMWETFGGSVDHLRSTQWMQVFRPWRWVTRLGLRLVRRQGFASTVAPVPAFPFRAAVGRWRALASGASAAGEPLTVEAILKHLPAVAGSARLRPHYDERYLEWLFEQVGAMRGYGGLVRRVVKRGSRALGWYVYYLRPGHRSRVIQIAARKRDAYPVLLDLFRHAHDHGAALLTGRVEPQLTEALRRLPCILGFGEAHVFHSRDPAIVEAIGAGESLFSPLDGEWWR